ncbi:MAG: ATPase [Frankiales bacterium]|nr:ATPase [Frankiales bacterium]
MAPSAAVRLHVVTGKGGTGKTTVAAALALGLAAGGHRVLLVEVEGRQGLAQLFDTPPLPYSETRLATAEGGVVIGLAVDPEAAMLDYLEIFYSMKRAGTVLRKMGAIDFVTTIAPGLRDVLLTGKVKEAVVRNAGGRPVFDSVVLDAPPTGRIAQFLSATREVADLTKFGPIYKQSAGVSTLLHSPLAVVHLVTLLEEMPVQETLDAAAELAADGYRTGRIIVNRARPDLVPAHVVGADVAGEELTRMGLDPALAPELTRQVSEYAERQGVQAAAGARLDAAGLPVITLPQLPAPMDLGSLFELAEILAPRTWDEPA